MRAASALLAVLALAACSRGGGESDGKLRVVAAFYPLAEAATRIGGDAVDVVNLTPPGVEPHDVELTPDQVDDLEDADLVVYVGGGFQPAVEELAERRDGGSFDALGVAETDDHEPDPHYWLDPDAYAESVTAIAELLADLDATAAAQFEQRAAAFVDELEQLAADMDAGLATCARREIVTSHDAFGHLARRFDLEQLAISGLAPESEPDPERLDDLAREIETRRVTTVFYEELVSPAVAETLAREVGVRTAVLSPLEGLSDDQRDDGATYASVMRANLAALRTALDCS